MTVYLRDIESNDSLTMNCICKTGEIFVNSRVVARFKDYLGLISLKPAITHNAYICRVYSKT